MRRIVYITITLLVVLFEVSAQRIMLTENLLKPRLDTLNWYKDLDLLNADYSSVANQCQTCVQHHEDEMDAKYCFNTSLAHVRLDTNLHNITMNKLIGEWKVISAGDIEISDSLSKGADKFIRKEKIKDDQNDAYGTMVFTERIFKADIKTPSNKIKSRKRFAVLEGRHLMAKKLIGMCGPTMIGMTNEGFLILDVHSFRSIAAKNEDYFVFNTYIRRTILEKIE